MKFNLPFIGEVRLGKDAAPIIQEIEKKDKFFDTLGGILQFDTGKLSNEKTISGKILQANKGWVYRNNDVIAQEVGKTEFELYQMGISQGEIVYNQVDSHPLLDLLDKPNPETDSSVMMYLTQSHKKLAGDAFWLKIRKNGQVVSLRVLQPDKVKLNLRAATENDPTMVESYEYSERVDGNEVKITYQPEEIIHFMKPNPSNPYRGIGAVEAFADTIDLDNLTTETTKKFFKNGAITNFVLSTESAVTPDQLTRLNAQMRATYAGASNAYKAMILGGGLKPVDISYSNKELEFLGQLEWYRDKIMVGFGNTKAALGIVEDVNRANAEASLGAWLRGTVKPDVQAIVDTLNEFLVPEFGDNLILGFCDPVPEDRTDDVSEAVNLYKGGIITRAEARELLTYDSEASDEEYYTQPQPLTPDQGANNDQNS